MRGQCFQGNPGPALKKKVFFENLQKIIFFKNRYLVLICQSPEKYMINPTEIIFHLNHLLNFFQYLLFFLNCTT